MSNIFYLTESKSGSKHHDDEQTKRLPGKAVRQGMFYSSPNSVLALHKVMYFFHTAGVFPTINLLEAFDMLQRIESICCSSTEHVYIHKLTMQSDSIV